MRHPIACGKRKIGLIVGALVLATSASGRSGLPNKTPNEARLREAEVLKRDYESLRDANKHAAAIPLAERACLILEEELGRIAFEVASCFNALASLHRMQGAYRKAEPLFERALLIREKLLPEEHLDLVAPLNNLAELYLSRGRYGEAELLLRRALTILEQGRGIRHRDVAPVVSNLAMLHWEQGAYHRAELLFKRALVIDEDIFGAQHPFVAIDLNNLAGLYSDQEIYDTAETLFERALDIYEVSLGPDHPSTANCLNNLALLYGKRGEYERAEPLLERALNAFEKAGHPNVAKALNNLATLRIVQGRYIEAKLLLDRAASSFESLHAIAHPDLAKSFNSLARLHYDQGDHDSALAAHQHALDIEEINLSRTLMVADEPRRLAYASTVSNSLHYALSLHLQVVPEHQAIAGLALTTLLRRKNRVQDLIAQSTAALRISLPKESRHVLDDLSDIDSQVAVLLSRGAGQLTVGLRQQIDELQEKRDRLWSDLAKSSGLVQPLDRFVTIDDVQRRLTSGVLVELTQYVPQHDDTGSRLRPHEPPPPPRYAAYLVFPDRIDWVDLGLAAPIDDNVEAFRKALRTKQAIPTDLYDAVMRPIVDKLGAADHLIIAPAGDLSLIPFGALHDGNHYLIEQYDLRYVTTGRDLLSPPTTPPVTTTPVTIVANPVGANLPDAELEAEFLTSLFPQTRILLDGQATETNVRTIERPLVLHMATHGFFGEALNERDNPLFRSGLYLADIDHVEVDRERDDGQLTAYEVSGMDLRGTQLVVLSACETGLGAAVRAEGKELMSEGMTGLRRAFAMAGARTTVMSLWEVSGATTQKTMEAYYRKLAEGLGRGEAMQAVQLEMLRSQEHAHPKDWAAFIVSGDDTPMVFPKGQEPRIEEEPQGPPPVPRRAGCAVAAPSPERDSSVPTFLLGLLGLGVLRRRRARRPSCGPALRPRARRRRALVTPRAWLHVAFPATPPITTTPVTIVANPTGANLPDAELEADFLASLFPRPASWSTIKLPKISVRTIECPLVLHMATHGFFCKALNERDNPLLRSGLYLADIDQVEVDRERDDGKLTAYDVSGMDLRGTQLVVLSGCETGLGAAVRAEGEELMSEGVTGLRGAFTMAGARTTVMSLWEVSGVTTQKTMEAYYRKLGEGMGRREAMQAVQLEMLRSEEHAHPKDWAAFIVSGDDMPMVLPAGQEPRGVEGKPEPGAKDAGCATKHAWRGVPTGSMLIGLLGLAALRRRCR